MSAMPNTVCCIWVCLAVLAILTGHCRATLVSVHTSAALTDSRIHTCSAGRTSAAGATDLSDCVCDIGVGGASPSALFGEMISRNTPYITSLAEDWDGSKFDSSCAGTTCVGDTGHWEKGTVTTGLVSGYGASVDVPYIQGTAPTMIQWGPHSIPDNYTICSVTRYASTGDMGRILNAKWNPDRSMNVDWYHGHRYWRGGVYQYDHGAAVYNNNNDDYYQSIDWIVMCGSNLR